MNITNITVKKIEGQKVLRGVASVVFDDELKVRDIKILEKEDKGLYLSLIHISTPLRRQLCAEDRG